MKRLFINLTPLLDMLLLIIFVYNMQSLLVVNQAKVNENLAKKNEKLAQENKKLSDQKLKDENEYRERIEKQMAQLKKEKNDIANELEKIKESNASLKSKALLLSSELSKIFKDINTDDIYKNLSGLNERDIKDITSKINSAKGMTAEKAAEYLARNSAAAKFITSFTCKLKDYKLTIINDDTNEQREVMFFSPLQRENVRNLISLELNKFNSIPKVLVLVYFKWGNALKSTKDIVIEEMHNVFKTDGNLTRFKLIEGGYDEKI